MADVIQHQLRVARADQPLIGKNMSRLVLTFDLEQAVALTGEVPRPQPARAKVWSVLRYGSVLVDLSPKSG
jgi:hypothetical protein